MLGRYIASLFFFIAISPYVFDEWVYQVQEIFLGKTYHLPLYGPMIIAFMVFIYVLRPPKNDFIVNNIFIIYFITILLMICYDMLVLSVGIDYAIHSWGQFIVIPLIFLLLLNMPNLLSKGLIRIIIVLFGFSISVLSICQYLTNSPIVSVGIPGSYFDISGWRFFGHVRGFGLFASPYASGSFYTLMVVYMFFRVVSEKKIINKLASIVVLLIFFLALLSTVTRSVYLDLLFAVLIAFSVLKKPYFLIKNYNKILFSQFLAGFIIIYIAPVVASYIKSDVFSALSLSIRLNEWVVYGLPLFNKLHYIIFGYARMQSISHGYGGFSGDVLIDNTYLAVLLFGGVVLLFLYMFFYYKIGKYLAKMSVFERDPFGLACLCVFLTMPYASFFNITYIVFPTFAFLGLLFLRGDASVKENNHVPPLNLPEKIKSTIK